MENCMLQVPLLTGCGLFDFKLKFGTAAMSAPRRTNAFEIELPVEEGGISYVAGNAYAIRPDRILCVKPGQLRNTKAPFRCYYIHVHPDDGEVCQILSSLPDSIPIKHVQPYIDLFRALVIAENETYCTGKFQTACLFLNLIHLLCADVQKPDGGKYTDNQRVNGKAIQDAVSWIDAHLSEKITLSQIANEVFLSHIYFRNLFTELVGISPCNYIQSRRLDRARQLLSTTNQSLSEIAEACGFSSQSYFGKVFKETVGCTPNAYRIMVNNQYP